VFQTHIDLSATLQTARVDEEGLEVCDIMFEGMGQSSMMKVAGWGYFFLKLSDIINGGLQMPAFIGKVLYFRHKHMKHSVTCFVDQLVTMN